MIDFACKQFNMDEIIKCSLGLSKADFRLMNFFLKEDSTWHTTQDIAKIMKLNLSTIQRCVKTLHKKEILTRSQENLNGGGYIFLYQIKNKEELRKKIKQIIHNWTKGVDKALESW